MGSLTALAGVEAGGAGFFFGAEPLVSQIELHIGLAVLSAVGTEIGFLVPVYISFDCAVRLLCIYPLGTRRPVNTPLLFSRLGNDWLE